jgi:hypothetical protein
VISWITWRNGDNPQSVAAMKWSYSAHRVMRRCQRQYAFEYLVASHASRDPLRHKVFLLKQLQSVSLWQGDLVHRVLAQELPQLIRNGNPINPHHLAEVADDLMRRQFNFSKERRYLQPGITKTSAGEEYCALVDHEYGLEISESRLAEVRTTIRHCFDALANDENLLERLFLGSGHRFEQWLSFPLDGATISVRLDLWFYDANGGPVVVDWKVAKSESSDYSSQLLVYTLALVRGWRVTGIDPGEIQLLEWNLLKGEERRHPVNTERLNDAEDYIYRSIIEMKALREQYSELDLNDFDVANSPGTCALCNYSQVCIDSLKAANRAEDLAIVQGRLF